MLQLTANNVPLGVEIMTSRGFFPYAYWYWIGAGALVGFVAVLNILYTAALAYLNRKRLYLLSSYHNLVFSFAFENIMLTIVVV